MDEAAFVILGATGHIGSAVATALLREGHPVRVVTRSADRGAAWRAQGADVAVADLLDPAALLAALSPGGPVRVFALNPPGAVTGDPDAAEAATADAIVDALLTRGPERVVALSTYGARAGRAIGDLGTLHRFEQRLTELSAPVAVLRAGYLLSNWDGSTARARSRGELPVMLDPDRALPMVAAADVGAEAARLLAMPTAARGVHHVEGPERSTPRDVAAAFAEALGAPVRVVGTAPEAWREAFLSAGFSAAAADSFTGLNRLVDREAWTLDQPPVRGRTTLREYVADLVAR